jgi:hypothetical protein
LQLPQGFLLRLERQHIKEGLNTLVVLMIRLFSNESYKCQGKGVSWLAAFSRTAQSACIHSFGYPKQHFNFGRDIKLLWLLIFYTLCNAGG